MEEKQSVIDKTPNKKRYILYTIIFVIITLTILIGVAYAAFGENYLGNKTTTIKAEKNLSFKYKETTEGLVSVSEMRDIEGKSQENYFDFDVVLNADTETSINYIIYLTKTEGALDNSAVKVYLTDKTNNQIQAPIRISDLTDYSSETNSKIIYTNSISGMDVTHSYRLRAWVDENYEGSSSSNISSITDGVNITTTSENYKFKVNVKIADKSFLSSEILKQGIVSSGDGLYVSTATNDGRPTYYYKGVVENNCISFANQIWRIVRINEDGTIRIMMETGIGNELYFAFNPNNNEMKYMYYTESNVEHGAMKRLNDWYAANLSSYDSKIATSTFCEASKTKPNDNFTSGNATMIVLWNYKNYDFKCLEDDGNGYGLITDQKIGLITLDELLFTTGGSTDYSVVSHLKNGTDFWTMSPAGFDEENKTARAWRIWGADATPGGPAGEKVTAEYMLRPVINLVSDITVGDAPFVTCPATAQ